jgi:hypothetical protein
MKKYFLLILLTCLFSLTLRAQSVMRTGKVIVDNKKMTVTEFYSMPGNDVCGKGKHSHPAHLTVLLTAATVTITDAKGKSVTRLVPSGTTFWSDAETHEVVNSGKMPVKVLIIVPK